MIAELLSVAQFQPTPIPQHTTRQRAFLGTLVLVGGVLTYLVLGRMLGLRLVWLLPIIALLSWLMFHPDSLATVLVHTGFAIGFFALILMGVHPYAITALIIVFTIAGFFIKAKIAGKEHRFTILLSNLILIGLVAFLAPAFFYGGPVRDAVDAQWEIAQETTADLWGGITGLKEAYQQEISLAMTGGEVAKIDENAKRNLGVYLFRDVSTEQTEFTEGEPIELFSSLRVETESTDSIGIDLKCYEKVAFGEGVQAHTITPNSHLEMKDLQQDPISCIFDSTELGTGSKQLYMEANFDFATSGYRTMYFMDREKASAYQGDPLDNENFKHYPKNTQPKAPPGPVALGFGFPGLTTSLIRVSSQFEHGPTLTLTVQNKWRGDITGIQELTITTPPGLKIKDIDGRTPMQCTGCGVDACTCTLSEPVMQELLKVNPVKNKLRTFSIHTEIADPGILLEKDFNVRNFIATLKYTYATKELYKANIKRNIVPPTS